jgi:hypothetical protein
MVVSRPAHDQARVTYTSTDAAAGLAKGAGTDEGAIAATVYLADENGKTTFDVAAGAFDGSAGWKVNDARRAAFVNKAAPGGPTGVSSLTVVAGRKVKLVTKSLGDTSPLAFGGAPTAALRVAGVVTNGAEVATHCTRFEPSDCAYTALDGGTGWKLRCHNGVADPSCSARAVCGNGIRESGEECDGGALCSPTCHQNLASCCQGAGACTDAPVFSTLYYLSLYCSGQLGGSQPDAGLVCQPDGGCADLPVDPVPVCCQTPLGCGDGSAASTSQLYFFLYYCNQGAGLGSGPYMVVNATCGAAGLCVPQ